MRRMDGGVVFWRSSVCEVWEREGSPSLSSTPTTHLSQCNTQLYPLQVSAVLLNLELKHHRRGLWCHVSLSTMCTLPVPCCCTFAIPNVTVQRTEMEAATYNTCLYFCCFYYFYAQMFLFGFRFAVQSTLRLFAISPCFQSCNPTLLLIGS
jgi:hypothetical protein